MSSMPARKPVCRFPTSASPRLCTPPVSARSLCFPDQARFHPLKYLAGLARAITQRGGRLFADTAVECALEENNGVVVKTDRGTVRATDVVFATNSPIGGSVTLHTKQAPTAPMRSPRRCRRAASPMRSIGTRSIPTTMFACSRIPSAGHRHRRRRGSQVGRGRRRRSALRRARKLGT